ncbi:MAG TPA: glycosyl transferase family 2 [Saprospirales bacterium]|nr:glycosyl transferase family 2 [Saprospirales bacterium]
MITITDLSLSFGERVIFDKISLAVKPKDKIGVVGKNGAGKTTLFKMIMGEFSPDNGSIVIPNGKSIGYLEQNLTLAGERSVMEETLTIFKQVREIETHMAAIEQELEHREDYESEAYHQLLAKHAEMANSLEIHGSSSLEAQAAKILHGLGFKFEDFSRYVNEFSGGWQMRIVLAKLLLSQPDYILLDEPTNHLDIESIIWLEKFLVDYPGAVMLISHDKQFLDAVTNVTVEIEREQIQYYKANYSTYLDMRLERQEKLMSSFKNQQRVILEKERTIARFMAKATKTKLAQSMQKKLDKIDRIELDEFDLSAMNVRFLVAERSGQVVLDAKDLIKNYGKIEVLSRIDLKMERGDRLAFIGQNGQGKTTLAKIIVGDIPVSAGHINLGHNVRIGYYSQNQSEKLDPKLTVLETMEQNSPLEMRTKLRGILGAFLFSGQDVDKKVSVLSGGEKARLALAVMLLRPFNFLIMDEPTNHLDLISKDVLKNALMDYEGSLIIVSHDRDFLAGLTNRTIEFRDKKLYDYPGDVNYFLEKRELDNMRQVEISTSSKKPESDEMAEDVKIQKKISYEERRTRMRAVQKAENEIERIEKEIAKIETEMQNPDFFQASGSNLTMQKYKQFKEQLETAFENWEIAHRQLEEMES